MQRVTYSYTETFEGETPKVEMTSTNTCNTSITLRMELVYDISEKSNPGGNSIETEPSQAIAT